MGGSLRETTQTQHTDQTAGTAADEETPVAETLGKWMPPFVPEDRDAERKRGATNKKVQNRRLKMELGYQFKHPTFRQGYTAEIKRLQDAGLLDLEIEPR